MDIGSAFGAIGFMLLLALLTAVSTVVLALAARSVLVVVQETGLGHDDITWPKELFQDWILHAVQFIELLGIWLFPAGLLARALRERWLEDDGLLRFLLLAVPGLWLFFPVGLLSSLSAVSRWMPFRLTIVGQLLRIFPAAVGFYLLTALVIGVSCLPWYFALLGNAVYLPVAALAGAAGLLIHARLLGRIALLIQRLPSAKKATPVKAKSTPRPPAKTSSGKKKRQPQAEAYDPWALSEEEHQEKNHKRFPWAEENKPKPKKAFTPPPPDEIEGYGFASTNPAPAPDEPVKRSSPPPDEEDEPITVKPPQGQELPRRDPAATPLFEHEVQRHIAERERTRLALPAHPLLGGTFTFPLYPRTLGTWLTLSLAFLIVGGIAQALLSLGRTLFGW